MDCISIQDKWIDKVWFRFIIQYNKRKVMKAVIHMRGIYGGTFSQTKEFKDDKHLDNWLSWMDKNQNRVKVIGTKII
jgi:hypothetical protein